MLFCCTFATRNLKLIAMGTTDRNHEAKQFSLDYLDYLMEQEGVVERMVDRKLKQMEPKIEKLIEQKIQKLINNK